MRWELLLPPAAAAPRPRVRRFHPAAARRCSVRVGRVIGTTRHYCRAGRPAIDHPSSENSLAVSPFTYTPDGGQLLQALSNGVR
jgi:hypothetical protein